MQETYLSEEGLDGKRGHTTSDQHNIAHIIILNKAVPASSHNQDPQSQTSAHIKHQ
jgi:hypothetical protein